MSKKIEWLFGYGSIIHKDSRNTTSYTFETYPARIIGYKRKWDNICYDCIGIIKTNNINDTVNGVISRISSKSINKFDNRECPWGYKRVQIPLDKCHVIKDILNKDNAKPGPMDGDVIYSYLLPRIDKDLSDCKKDELFADGVDLDCVSDKILQTYLDVIISGCLQYGKLFAIEFIKTTFNWHTIFNDRQNALREDFTNKIFDQCDQIDILLGKYLKEFHEMDLLSLRTTQDCSKQALLSKL